MIDSHAHIYLDAFKDDRNEIIERARNVGISHIVLPNIDVSTHMDMLATQRAYPKMCSVLIGLHPTSVNKDYKAELDKLFNNIETSGYIGVGEIGIDLYWDKTYFNEQVKAFEYQIDFSIENNLPIVIHARDSFQDIFKVLKRFDKNKLRGVFHSFTGGADEIKTIRSLGDFYFGINGIVTYKNSALTNALPHIGLEKILIETDAPYLSPTPNRGKRNEPSYLYYICKFIANSTGVDFEELDSITTKNAKSLFNL